MKVELKKEFSTPNPDDVVCMAARGDYSPTSMVGKSVEDAMEGTENSKKELIQNLLRSGHFGPTEHAQAYFAVEGLSRTAMAQITRHRFFSFDVQSQRYCDFSEKDTVIPPGDKQNPAAKDVVIDNNSGDDLIQDSFESAVGLYEDLISEGMAKEDARMVLPVGTKVDLTFSANSRSLMHLFDLRNNMKSQWEAREFAGKVLELCLEWSPLVFEAYKEHTNNNSLRAP